MLEHQFFNFIIPLVDQSILLGQDVAEVQPQWARVLFSLPGMMLFFGVLFYVMVLLPERQTRNKLAQRVAELKKNDRVVTVGGIHGSIVSTSETDQVVIRIDENNNTKITVNRSAISRVVADDEEKN